MSQAIISPDAKNDLLQIHDYIANDSPKEARDFVLRLRKRCKAIAASPGIGRRREEIMPGLQSIAEGNYVIYYRRVKGGIEVARILHGARNISRPFFTPPDEDE